MITLSRFLKPGRCALAVGCLAAAVASGAHLTPPDPPASPDAPQILGISVPKLRRTLGSDAGSVGCQVQDKAGNIWFSTGGNGVFRFDGHVFTNFTTRDGLSDNGVGAIIEDKHGNIVFGTGRGICSFDGKTITRRIELGEHKITCLHESRDGSLWFGTMTEGVIRFDGTKCESFLNRNGQRYNLGNEYQLILDILDDRSGNLWFSSWNGGGVWKYDGKTFTNLLPSDDYYRVIDGRSEDGRSGGQQLPFLPEYSSRTKTITDDMIYSIAEDRAGNIWFATRRHGACKYDPAAGDFTTFRWKEGFNSRNVYAILEDRSGNIWMTTEDTGVWRLGSDGKTFTNYTTNDGLVNKSVFSLLEDRDGNLWFGTREAGLSRYDGKTFTTLSE